jgi:hypothetical protein
VSAFDGWYASHADAPAIARSWRKEYPGWIIVVVKMDEGWFSNCDFAPSKNRPLTTRESCLQMRGDNNE